MVATDGHRLAMIDRALVEAKLRAASSCPARGSAEVRKLLDETGEAELTLVVAEKDVRVHTPDIVVLDAPDRGRVPRLHAR